MDPTTNSEAPPIQSIRFDERNGIVAQFYEAQSKIAIYNRDGAELFSFSSQACPFQAEPIGFLIDLYKIGFDRGSLVGKEVFKRRIRELILPEL